MSFSARRKRAVSALDLIHAGLTGEPLAQDRPGQPDPEDQRQHKDTKPEVERRIGQRQHAPVDQNPKPGAEDRRDQHHAKGPDRAQRGHDMDHVTDRQLQQPLSSKADHLAQKISIGGLLHEGAQVHHVSGHRWNLRSRLA